MSNPTVVYQRHFLSHIAFGYCEITRAAPQVKRLTVKRWHRYYFFRRNQFTHKALTFSKYITNGLFRVQRIVRSGSVPMYVGPMGRCVWSFWLSLAIQSYLYDAITCKAHAPEGSRCISHYSRCPHRRPSRLAPLYDYDHLTTSPTGNWWAQRKNVMAAVIAGVDSGKMREIVTKWEIHYNI